MNTTLLSLVASDENATAVRLQMEVMARLEADAYFATITVMDEQEKALDNDAKTALAGLGLKGGKRGAAVVVLEPEVDDETVNVSGGAMTYLIDVDVMEHLPSNRDTTNAGTGKVGAAIARKVVRTLKHFEAVGFASCLVPVTPKTIRVLASNSLCSVRRVSFKCKEEDVYAEVRLARPSIVRLVNQITLSAPDAGAAIYYTLDDTHPAAGNSAAVLYTVPFAITPPTVVRACAYKTGCTASDVNRLVCS